MTTSPSTDLLPTITLLDGGLGTTLESAPYNVTFTSATTPLWSSHLLLSDAEKQTLRDVQAAFVEAGAEVLLTATYQGSGEGVGRTFGWDSLRSEEQEEIVRNILRSAVGIAKDAFSTSTSTVVGKGTSSSSNSTKKKRKGKIALSLGAYGATMIPSQEYSGHYDAAHNTEEQLLAWHLNRIQILATDPVVWEDVDMVAFETLPRVEEVFAVRGVMASLQEGNGAKEKKFWITCVFPDDASAEDGTARLPDGSSIEEVVRAMLGPREGLAVPYGIGVNCTRVTRIRRIIGEMDRVVQEMVDQKEIREWPALVVKPDGTMGEVYNTETGKWERTVGDQSREGDVDSYESWAGTLMECVEAARKRGHWREILVGGCCRSTPRHIQDLRSRIDKLQT